MYFPCTCAFLATHFKIFVFLPYLVIPNQQRRKNKTKQAILLVPEAIKENDEPARMPPQPAVQGQQQIFTDMIPWVVSTH